MFRTGPPDEIRQKLEAALEQENPHASVVEVIVESGHAIENFDLGWLFVQAAVGPDEIWKAIIDARRARPGLTNWVFSD